jgi:multiple sugar transport system substrate-binding protein
VHSSHPRPVQSGHGASSPRSRSWRSGRLRALAVVALSVALLAAGCSSGGGGSSSGNGKTELSIIWWGGPARAGFTQKALDLYTQRHPNVTFKPQWGPNSAYYDKLATQVAGGKAPDIFQIDDNALTEYASRKIALDLDPYVGSVIKTDTLGKLKDAGKVGGPLYALPAAENTTALVYDKTAAQQAGVPEPRNGWSWDEYFVWAKQISDKSGGKVWGAMDGSGDYKVFNVWLRQQGKGLYANGQLGFSKADLQAWLDLWSKQRAAKAVAPAAVAHEAATGDVTKQLVATQKGATSFMHSNQLTELQKATEHQLGIASYPGPLSAQFVRPALFWAVYAGSKHAKEAADVINFLVNDPDAQKALSAERGLPPSPQVLGQLQSSFPATVQKVISFEQQVTPQLGQTPPPPPPGHSEIRQLLLTTAEDVAFGKQSSAAAADSFMNQAASILKS